MANLWGELIQIDDYHNKNGDYSRGSFIILTDQSVPINEVIEVDCGEKKYDVLISECRCPEMPCKISKENSFCWDDEQIVDDDQREEERSDSFKKRTICLPNQGSDSNALEIEEVVEETSLAVESEFIGLAIKAFNINELEANVGVGKNVFENGESNNSIGGLNKLEIIRDRPGALVSPFVALGEATENPINKLREEGGFLVSKNKVGSATTYNDARRVKCLEDIEDIIFDNISKKKKRKFKKAKQGQKKKGNLKGAKFANESFSDGDSINRNRKIVEEAKETWELGKLLGCSANCEDEVIVDRLIELTTRNYEA